MKREVETETDSEAESLCVTVHLGSYHLSVALGL